MKIFNKIYFYNQKFVVFFLENIRYYPSLNKLGKILFFHYLSNLKYKMDKKCEDIQVQLRIEMIINIVDRFYHAVASFH